MPASRGESLTFVYTAWNFSTNRPQTGDAGNHTLYLVKDGIQVLMTNSPSEIDAIGMPGQYRVSAANSEMDATIIVLGGKSATANVFIFPVSVITE